MFDKFTVLSNSIRDLYRKLVIRTGQTCRGYRYVLDLRKTSLVLPVILYFQSLHGHKYKERFNWKVEFVGVAELGRRRIHEILQELIPDLSEAKIYRIDAAVDIRGITVWDVAEACFAPRAQNFRMFRSRGAVVSYYPQVSKTKTIVFYDKARQLAAKFGPSASPILPGTKLTRVEVQLKGAGVPFQKLSEIERYGEIDLLAGVRFRVIRPIPKSLTGVRFLAAYGLRDLVRRHGQQAAAKRIGPQYWPYVRKTLFVPSVLKKIRRRLQKSTRHWLDK